MFSKRTHSSIPALLRPTRLAPARPALALLRLLLGCVVLALLAGCSALPGAENLTPLAMRTLGPYPSFTPAPSVTPKNTPTTAPSVTPRPTDTPTPSNTPTVTRTPTPSNTPTPTPMGIEALPGSRAGGQVAEQDVAKVVVRVSEVRLLPYEAALELNKPLFGRDTFRLVQTVGVLSLSVQNNTNTTVRIAPNKGLVVVGDEQVELERFAGFSDNVGGDLLPGILRDGYIVFGVRRYAPEGIDSIRLVLSAPANNRGRALSAKGYDLTVPVD